MVLKRAGKLLKRAVGSVATTLAPRPRKVGRALRSLRGPTRASLNPLGPYRCKTLTPWLGLFGCLLLLALPDAPPLLWEGLRVGYSNLHDLCNALVEGLVQPTKTPGAGHPVAGPSLWLLPSVASALVMALISLVRVVLFPLQGLVSGPRPNRRAALRPSRRAGARSRLAGAALSKTPGYRSGAPTGGARGASLARRLGPPPTNIAPHVRGALAPCATLGGAGARLVGPKPPFGALLKRWLLAAYSLGLLAPSVRALARPGLPAPLWEASIAWHLVLDETCGRLGPTPPGAQATGGQLPAGGWQPPFSKDSRAAAFRPWPAVVVIYQNSKSSGGSPRFRPVVVWVPQGGWGGPVCFVSTARVISMLAEDYDLHRAVHPFPTGLLGWTPKYLDVRLRALGAGLFSKLRSRVTEFWVQLMASLQPDLTTLRKGWGSWKRCLGPRLRLAATNALGSGRPSNLSGNLFLYVPLPVTKYLLLGWWSATHTLRVEWATLARVATAPRLPYSFISIRVLCGSFALNFFWLANFYRAALSQVVGRLFLHPPLVIGGFVYSQTFRGPYVGLKKSAGPLVGAALTWPSAAKQAPYHELVDLPLIRAYNFGSLLQQNSSLPALLRRKYGRGAILLPAGLAYLFLALCLLWFFVAPPRGLRGIFGGGSLGPKRLPRYYLGVGAVRRWALDAVTNKKGAERAVLWHWSFRALGLAHGSAHVTRTVTNLPSRPSTLAPRWAFPFKGRHQGYDAPPSPWWLRARLVWALTGDLIFRPPSAALVNDKRCGLAYRGNAPRWVSYRGNSPWLVRSLRKLKTPFHPFDKTPWGAILGTLPWQGWKGLCRGQFLRFLDLWPSQRAPHLPYTAKNYVAKSTLLFFQGVRITYFKMFFSTRKHISYFAWNNTHPCNNLMTTSTRWLSPPSWGWGALRPSMSVLQLAKHLLRLLRFAVLGYRFRALALPLLKAHLWLYYFYPIAAIMGVYPSFIAPSALPLDLGGGSSFVRLAYRLWRLLRFSTRPTFLWGSYSYTKVANEALTDADLSTLNSISTFGITESGASDFNHGIGGYLGFDQTENLVGKLNNIRPYLQSLEAPNVFSSPVRFPPLHRAAFPHPSAPLMPPLERPLLVFLDKVCPRTDVHLEPIRAIHPWSSVPPWTWKPSNPGGEAAPLFYSRFKGSGGSPFAWGEALGGHPAVGLPSGRPSCWPPRLTTWPHGGADPLGAKGPTLLDYCKGGSPSTDLPRYRRAPKAAHVGPETPSQPPAGWSGQGGPRYPYSWENYKHHHRDLNLFIYKRRASANYYKHDMCPSETLLRASPNSFSRELSFNLEPPEPPVEVPVLTTRWARFWDFVLNPYRNCPVPTEAQVDRLNTSARSGLSSNGQPAFLNALGRPILDHPEPWGFTYNPPTIGNLRPWRHGLGFPFLRERIVVPPTPPRWARFKTWAGGQRAWVGEQAAWVKEKAVEQIFWVGRQLEKIEGLLNFTPVVEPPRPVVEPPKVVEPPRPVSEDALIMRRSASPRGGAIVEGHEVFVHPAHWEESVETLISQDTSMAYRADALHERMLRHGKSPLHASMDLPPLFFKKTGRRRINFGRYYESTHRFTYQSIFHDRPEEMDFLNRRVPSSLNYSPIDPYRTWPHRLPERITRVLGREDMWPMSGFLLKAQRKNGVPLHHEAHPGLGSYWVRSGLSRRPLPLEGSLHSRHCLPPTHTNHELKAFIFDLLSLAEAWGGAMWKLVSETFFSWRFGAEGAFLVQRILGLPTKLCYAATRTVFKEPRLDLLPDIHLWCTSRWGLWNFIDFATSNNYHLIGPLSGFLWLAFTKWWKWDRWCGNHDHPTRDLFQFWLGGVEKLGDFLIFDPFFTPHSFVTRIFPCFVDYMAGVRTTFEFPTGYEHPILFKDHLEWFVGWFPPKVTWMIPALLPFETYLRSLPPPGLGVPKWLGRHRWWQLYEVPLWDAKCTVERPYIIDTHAKTKYHFRIIPTWLLQLLFPSVEWAYYRTYGCMSHHPWRRLKTQPFSFGWWGRVSYRGASGHTCVGGDTQVWRRHPSKPFNGTLLLCFGHSWPSWGPLERPRKNLAYYQQANDSTVSFLSPHRVGLDEVSSEVQSWRALKAFFVFLRSPVTLLKYHYPAQQMLSEGYLAWSPLDRFFAFAASVSPFLSFLWLPLHPSWGNVPFELPHYVPRWPRSYSEPMLGCYPLTFWTALLNAIPLLRMGYSVPPRTLWPYITVEDWDEAWAFRGPIFLDWTYPWTTFIEWFMNYYFVPTAGWSPPLRKRRYSTPLLYTAPDSP